MLNRGTRRGRSHPAESPSDKTSLKNSTSGYEPFVSSVRSMYYDAFYALGFIFRNRGPLQKVCRDADTHAMRPGRDCPPARRGRPRLRRREPEAAAAMCQNARFRGRAGWRHKHSPTRPHCHRPHAFPCAPTNGDYPPVSADFVPLPPRVKDWAPVGSCL
jgi:hypothetical protein